MTDVNRLARIAYAAYGGTTDHKNYQGLPMPEFDDLGERIQEAWRNAVDAVQPASSLMPPIEITVTVDLDGPDSRLARIERAVESLKHDDSKEIKIMGTLEDGLAEVETAVAAEDTAILAETASVTKLDADETVALAALTQAIADGKTLSDADQARFDALTAKANADAAAVASAQAEVDADDAALNAAVPAAPVTPAE